MDDQLAIDLLQDAFDKYSEFCDDEALNILTELLITSHQFSNAFEVKNMYMYIIPVYPFSLSFYQTGII